MLATAAFQKAAYAPVPRPSCRYWVAEAVARHLPRLQTTRQGLTWAGAPCRATSWGAASRSGREGCNPGSPYRCFGFQVKSRNSEWAHDRRWDSMCAEEVDSNRAPIRGWAGRCRCGGGHRVRATAQCRRALEVQTNAVAAPTQWAGSARPALVVQALERARWWWSQLARDRWRCRAPPDRAGRATGWRTRDLVRYSSRRPPDWVAMYRRS